MPSLGKIAVPTFAIAGLLLAAGISSATAKGRFGGPPATDPVTGYHCVTNNCNVVRLPDAYCICEKVNPGEQVLGRLKLACYTKEAGHWTSCPVKPRYGISVR